MHREGLLTDPEQSFTPAEQMLVRPHPLDAAISCHQPVGSLSLLLLIEALPLLK